MQSQELELHVRRQARARVDRGAPPQHPYKGVATEAPPGGQRISLPALDSAPTPHRYNTLYMLLCICL